MKLTVSMAQIAIASSKPEENLQKGEKIIVEAKRRSSDMICFPEMWTTGLKWPDNERFIAAQKKTSDLVADMAKRYRIWINSPMLMSDNSGKAYNASVLFDPQGEKAGIYRKTHLFTMIREEDHFAPGKSLCIIDTPWGKIGLTICYDIRFPELFRTYALKGVKIILSPMAFPASRIEHWKILLRARAIENQLFMIGANRIGEENLENYGMMTYCGNSAVIDPWGNTVIEGSEAKEELLTASIDIDKADEVRSKMNVLRDRRPDIYELG